MGTRRKYYEAYDDRYKQVHKEALRWASGEPSAIVRDTIIEYGISEEKPILELGCGEGRDAAFLLKNRFRVMATDISKEAISYCRKADPAHAECYQVLDCIDGTLDERFSFIYAVAVVHMLVEDQDRNGFYRFIREHLTEDGVALICTMGDGEVQMRSDIRSAFDLQEREHQETGRKLLIAGTSCRIVSFDTFAMELAGNGLAVLKQGITSVQPDFDRMMYAVVKKKNREPGTGSR